MRRREAPSITPLRRKFRPNTKPLRPPDLSFVQNPEDGAKLTHVWFGVNRKLDPLRAHEVLMLRPLHTNRIEYLIAWMWSEDRSWNPEKLWWSYILNVRISEDQPDRVKQPGEPVSAVASRLYKRLREALDKELDPDLPHGLGVHLVNKRHWCSNRDLRSICGTCDLILNPLSGSARWLVVRPDGTRRIYPREEG